MNAMAKILSLSRLAVNITLRMATYYPDDLIIQKYAKEAMDIIKEEDEK